MKSPQPLSRTLLALLGGLLLLNQASAVTNSWSGAGANDNWSTPGNWTLGTPGLADSVEFNDTDSGVASPGPTGIPDNIVSSSITNQTLKYGNTNGFHTTQISSGSTLTIAGTQSPIVLAGTDTDAGAAVSVYATILGQGRLFVTNGSATGIFSVRQGATANGTHRATLDMEGLDTFTAYVGRIWVAGDNGGTGTPQINRSQGTLIFAKTNFIFCRSTVGNPGLLIAETAGNGGTCIVKLGQTNVIFSDAGITVGGRKSINSTMTFNASFTSPGAVFRNAAGTGRQAFWTIGDEFKQSNSALGASGTADFSNGTVDALIITNIVGRGSVSPGPAFAIGTGILTFTAGTIDQNTLLIGVQPAGGGGGVGTVNVTGTGLLLANSLIRLADGAGSSGTLNITGGTVRANAIENGGGTTAADITMSGGTLTLTNTAGSSVSRILNFTAADSTLNLPVSAAATNIYVNTLTASGSSTNNTINVLSLPNILGYPAQFPIISYVSYSPGGSDFLLGTLPSGSPAFQGYLSNNTANSTIDLVLTNGPGATIRALTWNGNINSNWNTNTLNWKDSSLVSTFYSQGDIVTFDDSATGATNVNLSFSLSPGSLTISNLLKDYSFTGVGSLDGTGSLVKDGTGQFTLANSSTNSFAGGVSILSGSLKLGGSDDRLPTNSIVTMADVSGARLDLNNLNQTIRSLNGGGPNGGEVALGSGKLTDWSGGTFGGVISGTGQLIKTNFPGIDGGTLTLTNASTYSGGTVIGGTTNNTTLVVANSTGSGTGSGYVRVLTNGSLYIGNGGEGGSVAFGVITNDGTVRINRSDDITFTNLIVGSGVLQTQNTNTIVILGANPYTGGTAINPGIVRISNPGALGTGTITVGNGVSAVLQLTNNITVTNTLTIQSKPSASGVVPNVENINGNNTISGPIQLTQNGAVGWLFFATADRLTVSGTMATLTPSQTSQNGSRILWLRGDAIGEWTSGIIDTVNSITNVALRKDGAGTWTLSGANTYSGATVVSNGTLVVNGSITASTNVTIAGGTLGGTGLISSSVMIGTAGTLAPGTSIGTLTISNSLALTGTTIMEVSHSAADRVAGIGSLSLGGTLTVVTNGTLTGGEVFQLFSATNYSGDFSFYDLPVLPSPLGWDASLVPVTGTLSVTGAVAVLNPIPLTVARTNNVLTFSWTNGVFRLQSQTNPTSLGLKTNWFDYPGGGSSPVNVTIDGTKPTVFFRLITP